MATTLSPLAEALNQIINAIVGIISAVATTIADNAAIIGTVLVIGALSVAVMTVGRKIIGSLSGWFRGMF